MKIINKITWDWKFKKQLRKDDRNFHKNSTQRFDKQMIILLDKWNAIKAPTQIKVNSL